MAKSAGAHTRRSTPKCCKSVFQTATFTRGFWHTSPRPAWTTRELSEVLQNRAYYRPCHLTAQAVHRHFAFIEVNLRTIGGRSMNRTMNKTMKTVAIDRFGGLNEMKIRELPVPE
jgi:hypothetical protein